MGFVQRSPVRSAGALLAAALLAGAPAWAAGTGTLSVSATVLSKSICKLTAASLSVSIAALDPSASSASNSGNLSFTCHGSDPVASFSVTAGNGLNYSGGSRRMQHASVLTQFLPYTVSLSPATGTVAKNVLQNVSVTVSAVQADFGDAIAGSYSDTVEITLSP